MLKIILLILLFSNNALSQEVIKPALIEKELPDLKDKMNKVGEAVSSLSGADAKTKLIDGVKSISKISKTASLMFEFDQSSNVDKAVESLKTNQVYAPLDAVPNEVEKKDSVNLVKEEEKKSQESEKSYIYLSSIIYFGPNNWAVWINKQKFTPQSNSKDAELYLKHVAGDKVNILWTLSMSKWRIISGQKNDAMAPAVNSKNQVEVEFELRPNQTFILGQNAVVEGRAVTNLIRQKNVSDVKKNVDAADNKAKVIENLRNGI